MKRIAKKRVQQKLQDNKVIDEMTNVTVYIILKTQRKTKKRKIPKEKNSKRESEWKKQRIWEIKHFKV